MFEDFASTLMQLGIPALGAASAFLPPRYQNAVHGGLAGASLAQKVSQMGRENPDEATWRAAVAEGGPLSRGIPTGRLIDKPADYAEPIPPPTANPMTADLNLPMTPVPAGASLISRPGPTTRAPETRPLISDQERQLIAALPPSAGQKVLSERITRQPHYFGGAEEGHFRDTGVGKPENIVPGIGRKADASPEHIVYDQLVKEYGGDTTAAFEHLQSLKAKDKERNPPSVGTDREALAQQMGFKSYAEAPPETMRQINVEVKKREDERIKQGQTRIDMSKETANQLRAPTGSAVIDKESGDIYQPEAFTREDLKSGKYTLINPATHDQIKYIQSAALPAVQQLKELVPRLAVKAGGQNLINYIQKELAKGVGIDPDVQQYQSLKTQLAAEEARIITGGSRVVQGMFNKLETETTPSLKQTQDVQNRVLDTAGWNFENRLRGLKGQKSVTFKDFMTRQGSGAPAGQAAIPAGTPATPARPQKRNPKTGEVVEFDGTQWVPVKK